MWGPILLNVILSLDDIYAFLYRGDTDIGLCFELLNKSRRRTRLMGQSKRWSRGTDYGWLLFMREGRLSRFEMVEWYRQVKSKSFQSSSLNFGLKMCYAVLFMLLLLHPWSDEEAENLKVVSIHSNCHTSTNDKAHMTKPEWVWMYPVQISFFEGKEKPCCLVASVWLWL